MNKMSLAVLTLLIWIFAIPSKAQTTPILFTVSDVAVGPQRLETLFLYAAGKWSDAPATLGSDSTQIHCFKLFGLCEVASSTGGNVRLFTYEILTWDNQKLIADEHSSSCFVSTLRFDFAAKTVSLSSAHKNTKLALNDANCKAIGEVPTVFLGQGH